MTKFDKMPTFCHENYETDISQCLGHKEWQLKNDVLVEISNALPEKDTIFMAIYGM